MKKKAAALAVGALFAAPAAHAQITFGNDQIGTVQIYGKLYPQVAYFKADGATQPGTPVSHLVSATGVLGGAPAANHGGRVSVDTQNSYIGFRGQRAFGATGLKGIWQVEQSVGLDGEGDVWSNRNSFVGLGHKLWGTIKLGNMDTIYKEYGGPVIFQQLNPLEPIHFPGRRLMTGIWRGERDVPEHPSARSTALSPHGVSR